jgi:predicted transcriptional regulator
MRLRQPTDFLILEALHTYGRNVATNLAKVTGKSRKNVNNRLPVLADYGLVRKVGPAERSGLYEITDSGTIAIELREQYDGTDEFEALIERRLENTASDATAVAARGDAGEDDESAGDD